MGMFGLFLTGGSLALPRYVSGEGAANKRAAKEGREVGAWWVGRGQRGRLYHIASTYTYNVYTKQHIVYATH